MFSIPQSEQCLIGGILINPDCLREIRAELAPNDFSSEKNKYLFQSFLDLADNGDPLLPTAIVNDLRKKQNLIKAGGSDYLADILSVVHTSAGWRYHIKQIKNYKLTQALLGLSSDITEGAAKSDARDLLAQVKERIAGIKAGDAGQDVVEISDVLPDVVSSLDGQTNPGISTGFYRLDALIGGWQAGDLIILAGRPGMGKSVLAKDFAEASGVPVLFFSLEMPIDQLVKRQISAHSNVNYTSIRRSRIDKNGMVRIIKAANELDKLPIAYNDKANMSIDELIATCEARKRKQDVGMVVIDYLQLIRSNGKVEHREREVAMISAKLKGLARSLNIPVICLAQLNRACEIRGGDKKPMLSDLRESGSIEQDADTVMFIWRQAQYVETEENKHQALLQIAKGRNTGTGKVGLYFDGSRQVFRDAAEEDEGGTF